MADISFIHPKKNTKKVQGFFDLRYFDTSHVELFDIIEAFQDIEILDMTFEVTTTCWQNDTAIWQWEVQRPPAFNLSNDFETDTPHVIHFGFNNQENKKAVGFLNRAINQSAGESNTNMANTKTINIGRFRLQKGDHLMFKLMRFINTIGAVNYGQGLFTFTVAF